MGVPDIDFITNSIHDGLMDHLVYVEDADREFDEPSDILVNPPGGQLKVVYPNKTFVITVEELT